MKQIPDIKAAAAQVVLNTAPPLIRDSLLDRHKFRENYHVKVESILTIGDSGFSVRRSDFYEAVRHVLGGSPKAEVTDLEGRVWDLNIQTEQGDQPCIFASSSEQRLALPDFVVLSQDSALRLRSFNSAASDVNLPKSAQDSWRAILAERALEDEEFALLLEDIRDTPIYFERAICNEIRAGQSSVSTLVPSSRRYFERLIGLYDGSVSINEYAARTGRKFIQQLNAWQPRDGFLLSLFLSSHAALTEEISANQLEGDNLVQVYDFIENHGDVLSQLGAIEVGIRILRERPGIVAPLVHLVRGIRDDDLEGSGSSFNLFTACFVLVDGELSRIRLMSKEPPFYRRLASLAQASLIHRQLIHCRVDFDLFCHWAFGIRREQFYMQSFADMRTEPRWNPGLSTASQIKADFFGRIMIAAERHESNINSSELRHLVIGDEPQSLKARSVMPTPFLPGPLEASGVSPNELSDGIAELIDKQLGTEEAEPISFTALVNSAMIFKVTSDHADLAARTLRLGNHHLSNVEGRSQLLDILYGLATVAAVTRNSSLANELRIMVRRYRHDPQFAFSIEESMRINLLASASRQDPLEWREFVGECFAELAYENLDRDQAEILYSRMHSLMQVVPELWITCAKADAALKSILV